jgi:hypothetical protein
MKRSILTIAAFAGATALSVAQTLTAVGVVTLTGAPSTPMEVAYNPINNLYYASAGGYNCNNLLTYSVTGGAAISTTSECYDSRGLWWNSLTNTLEGNSYNSAGIYTMALSGGIPTGVGAIAAANSQPNAQVGGQFDPTTNQVLYYDGSLNIQKYNRANPGALVSTVPITGLPVGYGTLSTYGFYTGAPGSEYAVYDVTYLRAYLINYTTGAYVATVQFPNTAGNYAYYNLSYANGLYFICNGSTWIGYHVCPIIKSIPANGIVCSGSTVTLTAEAGGVVTYTWSNGANTSSITATPSVNTTYSLNTSPLLPGCISTSAAITITVGGSPTVAISGSTLICGTGTNVLTASGADTYSWSNGATNPSVSLSPSVTANYTVIGTSTVSGCTNTQTVSMVVSQTPTITVNSGSLCSGSSFTMTPAGANTYTFQGGNAVVSPTADASYTVIGTNTAGCVSQTFATSNITVAPAPSLSVSGTPSVCAGQSATLNASGANTYSWNTGASTSSVVVSPSATAVYTAIGTATNGCSSTSTISVIVSICTGIDNNSAVLRNPKAYPNPANSELTIELANGQSKLIEMFDFTGKLVYTTASDKDAVQLNVASLANGIYNVKVQSDKAVSIIKIVKQ